MTDVVDAGVCHGLGGAVVHRDDWQHRFLGDVLLDLVLALAPAIVPALVLGKVVFDYLGLRQVVDGRLSAGSDRDPDGGSPGVPTGRYLDPRISRKDCPSLVSVPMTARMPSLNPNLTLAALQVRS